MGCCCKNTFEHKMPWFFPKAPLYSHQSMYFWVKSTVVSTVTHQGVLRSVLNTGNTNCRPSDSFMHCSSSNNNYLYWGGRWPSKASLWASLFIQIKASQFISCLILCADAVLLLLIVLWAVQCFHCKVDEEGPQCPHSSFNCVCTGAYCRTRMGAQAPGYLWSHMVCHRVVVPWWPRHGQRDSNMLSWNRGTLLCRQRFYFLTIQPELRRCSSPKFLLWLFLLASEFQGSGAN